MVDNLQDRNNQDIEECNLEEDQGQECSDESTEEKKAPVENNCH